MPGAGARASAAEASPTRPQVSGSSKNPAYSSEWTKSATATAASPMPNARSARVTSTSAQPTAADEPQVGGEAHDAELREHGERRRVRGVAPRRASPGRLGTRLRLAADPDARDGPLLERVEGDLDEPRAPARDIARRAAVGCRPGDSRGDDRRDERAGDENDPRAPVASHERDAERHDEERDEARLRVRVVEAPEEERDEGGRRDPVDGTSPPDEDRDEQHGDRNDEVPAVQARILEERRDPEERRVGVRHLDVAGEEERARLRLPDPDRGEQGPECDERDEERAGQPAREWRPRDHGEPGDEREDEERERDRPRALVPRPQERRRGQRDERRERQREEEGRRRRSLPADDPIREREHRRCDDEVQREQQERLLAPQLDGEAERRRRQERDRSGGRVADEGCGTDQRDQRSDSEERSIGRLGDEKPQVVAADQRQREAADRGGEEPEPEEREDPAAWDENEDCAERSDERRDLSDVCVLHGASTLRGVAEPALHSLELRRDAPDRRLVPLSPLLALWRRHAGSGAPGRELAREPLDRVGEGQAQLAVDAAQLVRGRRDEVLVRQVDPGRRAR